MARKKPVGVGGKKSSGSAGGKRRRGKKGRKGRKKKKKRVLVDGPPLHELSELYKKLEDATRKLYESRILSRKKRFEGWIQTRAMINVKVDNELFNEHLDDDLNSIGDLILKLKADIEIERKRIKDEVDRLMSELDKKKDDLSNQKSKLEYDVQNVRNQLMEFEPLMRRLEELYNQIELIEKEIEIAQIEADKKTRHLKNQYLNERDKLYKHLEEELYKLIKNVRGYLMPLILKIMQTLEWKNACFRWRLRRVDAKNIKLGEMRERLLEERKMLTLEKEYWNPNWVFQKLAEMKARKRARKHEELMSRNRPEVHEPPPTELAIAFNMYLKKRLCAIKGAKLREERRQQREARRLRFQERKRILNRIYGQKVDEPAYVQELKDHLKSQDIEQSTTGAAAAESDWESADEAEEDSLAMQTTTTRMRNILCKMTTTNSSDPQAQDQDEWMKIAENIYYSGKPRPSDLAGGSKIYPGHCGPKFNSQSRIYSTSLKSSVAQARD